MIYLTYHYHPALNNVLKFKVVLTTEKLYSLIVCMVHYLEVTDDNLIEQRCILKNFIQFCQTIPNMPTSHIYYLFVLYPKNLYIIELEELMYVLYKKKMLNEVIPVAMFRISENAGSATVPVFQKLKQFFKRIIDCPDELILFHGHIVLTVLDMIKKKAVVSDYDLQCNRLETLKALNMFRSLSIIETM